MSKIDDVLSDTTNSLSTTLQDFFKSLQTLVSNAEDPAARQTVLGKAGGLVNQFKTNDQYLRDQDTQVNTAISSSVSQINNYATQIANLNDQISRLTGVGAGASPNDLLDQRDQLVTELNKIVGVEVSVQDSGTFNISLGNGYSLVQGSKASQLAAVKSSADPARTTIAYVDDVAGNIEIPEKLITTGSLGGLLTFRAEDLDKARNTLNQMALAFADAMNTQHEAGFDANGDAGGKLFNFGSPAVLSNSKNGGSAVVTASVTDSKQVQATDYKLQFNGTDWTVTRTSDKTSFTMSPDASGNLSFDGLNVNVSGTANTKDSFTVKPVSNVIMNMDLAISDESKLAMASVQNGGESDNRNGQKLLDLQSAKVVGGNKTFNDAYASLVSTVGSSTASLKVSSQTKANVETQLIKQQQTISGVNLDEEYGNLQRYQQYYLANAQVLQTASTLFDAIINIR
jgi:flagellar hook-associated protein 1 FlgK